MRRKAALKLPCGIHREASDSSIFFVFFWFFFAIFEIEIILYVRNANHSFERSETYRIAEINNKCTNYKTTVHSGKKNILCATIPNLLKSYFEIYL